MLPSLACAASANDHLATCSLYSLRYKDVGVVALTDPAHSTSKIKSFITPCNETPHSPTYPSIVPVPQLRLEPELSSHGAPHMPNISIYASKDSLPSLPIVLSSRRCWSTSVHLPAPSADTGFITSR